MIISSLSYLCENGAHMGHAYKLVFVHCDNHFCLLEDNLVITDDEDVFGVTGGETALTCVLTSGKVKRIFWYNNNELQGG